MHRRLASFLLGTLGALCLPSTAGADAEQRLTALESEARQLGTDLPTPNQLSGAQHQRKLVDAQIAFSLGDYDEAALALFDLASKPGPDQETATYYLAESLYQKGDRGGARTYFEQLAGQNNAGGKYYQTAVLRIVEIGIAQRDTQAVAPYVSQLNGMASGPHATDVAYVKGKLAFNEGKLDDALAAFALVPKGNEHEMQAAYYTATTLVAKKELAKATEIYVDLVGRKPKTAQDRRIIELSQLALGRLYYEQNQPSKSIDSYLLVDRHSDLFPDALYEVAWVYVKSKQYDKALRALELLAQSEPESHKTPTVRILEGNLRIRKAQMIRQAQIIGTLDVNVRNADPAAEYDKANKVFTETHDMYAPSYEALAQMVDTKADAGQYLSQLAGRNAHVFQTTAPMPEAAAQYLREEPEVQRALEVETDLGEVESNIAQSEAIIARLEGVLAANDRTAVYPALQTRRSRIGEMQRELIKLRSDLHDQLGGSDANRKALVGQYLAMPNAEQARVDMISKAQADYDAVETAAGEVSSAIDSTQAMAVAMRKYATDAKPAMDATAKTNLIKSLDEAAKEAQAIEDEIQDVQREIVLGRDLAAVGDENTKKARDLRTQVKAAEDAEFKSLRGSGKAAQLAERAARLADDLDRTEAAIDAAVDTGMQQVKTSLAQEKASLGGMKRELDELSAESRSIGGTVLGASFKDVKDKFYDIVIRTDVGNVDVSWAQKEDDDDDLKRLNLSRARELKQLKDEFRDVLQPATVLQPTPKPAPTTEPGTEPKPPAGSPDKGNGEGRIKPGGEGDKTPAQPTVKPGDTTTQPKKAPAKTPAKKTTTQPKTGGGTP
ncbi:MAG TPA: tetratricopeptide repeat protein [Kofleriaceae bacterium]|nr:tetratricopeptide repeat protein [Kofleriaceae bacterium]